jgi:proline iminopeptidase
MERLEIGGVEQSVWFRGRDARAPVLVLLHGGPGASTLPLFRRYVPSLEDHFLVVYWQQRGAGRSYHAAVREEPLTIDRMLRDLDELVDLTRARFGRQRVVLLGHSWGTILGTLYAATHPEKVDAYVGVAQIATFSEGERISFEWALEEAEHRGDDGALRALRAMEPAPSNVSEELELGRWVERFGGSTRAGLSTGRLIWDALRAKETSLIDLWKFGAGNRFSLESLRPQYSRIDLTRHERFETPVIFILGRHDWHVPSVLAERYFETISAPCKRLIWFEDSAHNPPFEQPAAFVDTVVESVLPHTGTERLIC